MKHLGVRIHKHMVCSRKSSPHTLHRHDKPLLCDDYRALYTTSSPRTLHRHDKPLLCDDYRALYTTSSPRTLHRHDKPLLCDDYRALYTTSSPRTLHRHDKPLLCDDYRALYTTSSPRTLHRHDKPLLCDDYRALYTTVRALPVHCTDTINLSCVMITVLCILRKSSPHTLHQHDKPLLCDDYRALYTTCFFHMASVSSSATLTPPGSLDLNQPGFKKEILGTKLEVKYLCSDCKNILRRPFQAQCGHRYCSHCLRKIISAGPQKCAACIQEGLYEEGVSILESSSAFPDNAARREVEGLPAVCTNKDCTWRGTIKEYELIHEGKCPFMLVPCLACNALILASQRDWHNERECPERKLNCRYCKLSFYFPDIKAHDEICPKFPMTCDGCGKKKIPREKFQDHVKSCGRCKVPCRYVDVGCEEMVENDKSLEHDNKFLADHLGKVWDFIQLSLRLGLSVQNSPGPLTSGLPPTTGDASQLSDTLKKLDTMERIVCVLNREVEKASMTTEELLKQQRAAQEKIETLNAKVRQLERTLSQKDLVLTEMETRIQETELSTYDGIFIWKITDFAKKRQDAIVGRCPAMFSPPFYTNKYGYKMCLRIYLNGDGTGRGTHLSLFFVVMKGSSDALLRWPFNQKVTLMLLDQNNREHVIDAFRPDITSSSFQRPVSEMNIASGCPLFCPLSKLEAKNSYIREDTIFIKAIVDLTGL
ncbi:TNF receptor-associated factor 2 [Rhinophrynus dorsalis]